MEANASQGIRHAAPSPLDSIRELVVFFIRYVELRLQLLGLESRETAFHLLVVALLLVSAVVCFGCFVSDFSALPHDADAALGMGLERPSTCSWATCPQYWSGNNLQIQDRKPVFPGNVRRASKGS